MPGSPLERHKSDFPASVGTGRPQPHSTAGETEAERGPGENPLVWWLCPQNARTLPRERRLPSRGQQLPSSRRAPARSHFTARFWHGGTVPNQAKEGKKK